MKVEVRLGDEDRAKHGGDEWLEFDPTAYDDWSLAELSALERPIRAVAPDFTLWNLLNDGSLANTALGRAAGAWLARQQAGLDKPSFDKFDIKPMHVRIRLNRGPAVPLDGDSPTPGESPASSQPSPATAPSKKRSHS